MKPTDFFKFLERFADQPVPATLNRHVYLWLGDIDDLLSKSPPGFMLRLDLHLLCQNIKKAPIGDKAAGRELASAIDEWITTEIPNNQGQQALLVTGLDLLYRYSLPLSTFIRLANENMMIILGLSKLDTDHHPPKALPSYIQFSPSAILRYAAAELSEEAVVKEE